MSKRSAVTQSPSRPADKPDVLVQELEDDGMFSYSRFPLVYRGAARVQLGDERGVVQEVHPGDVIIIPWARTVEAGT